MPLAKVDNSFDLVRARRSTLARRRSGRTASSDGQPIPRVPGMRPIWNLSRRGGAADPSVADPAASVTVAIILACKWDQRARVSKMPRTVGA